MPEFDAFWTSAAFQGVLTRHNGARATLSRWRDTFAGVATELATFFRRYPGVTFSQSVVEAAIRRKAALPAGVGGTSVYRPWQGWWCGTFNSAGSAMVHHHVWDETVTRSSVDVQPVTQSKHRFVGASNLASMLTANKVDLAINVFSRTDGLTGWVSKRQWGAGTEHPHIAYYLDATHVIWVTQQEGTSNPYRWFMFFEWSNSTLSPTRYGIHGREFEISSGRIGPPPPERHYGTYRSQPAGSTTCPP